MISTCVNRCSDDGRMQLLLRATWPIGCQAFERGIEWVALPFGVSIEAIDRGGHYPGILEIPEFFLLIWSSKF